MPSDSCVRGSDGCEIKGRHDMCGTVLGPDQERSEPSPAEVNPLVATAMWNLDDTCKHAAMPGDCAAPHRVCGNCAEAILTRLVEATERAAKREALRDAYKIARPWMDGGISYAEWEAAVDRLSALESSGEAK